MSDAQDGLRDEFAMAALQGLLTSMNASHDPVDPFGKFMPRAVCATAYVYADCMLAARGMSNPKKQAISPKEIEQ